MSGRHARRTTLAEIVLWIVLAVVALWALVALAIWAGMLQASHAGG